MRGILIDPKARTVTEVEVASEADGTTLASMYAHLECSTVQAVCLWEEEGSLSIDLWIDEEGLFADEQHRFFISRWPYPITGRGLLLCSDDGEARGCPLSIEDTVGMIAWARQ